jgi:hypothetical protein
MELKQVIKACFENTTMCARSHGPQEAYAYAERMEGTVKLKIVQMLQSILQLEPSQIKLELEKLLLELKE